MGQMMAHMIQNDINKMLKQKENHSYKKAVDKATDILNKYYDKGYIKSWVMANVERFSFHICTADTPDGFVLSWDDTKYPFLEPEKEK